MKNRLSDLNNHLFESLERLSDEDLKGEQLSEEVVRAGAVVSVSDQIISNAKLRLEAVKVAAIHGDRAAGQLATLTDSAPMQDGVLIASKRSDS